MPDGIGQHDDCDAAVIRFGAHEFVFTQSK